MDEHFEDDRRFMIGLWAGAEASNGCRQENSRYRCAEIISVDLGGRILEVRHFGFAQTPGDLGDIGAQLKVLWVGNMIQAPSPAPALVAS